MVGNQKRRLSIQCSPPDALQVCSRASGARGGMEGRARGVGCVIPTSSSATLYNLSSAERLYSCLLLSREPWGVNIWNRFPTTFLWICESGEGEAVYRRECFERPFLSSYKNQYLYVRVLHVGTCLVPTLRQSVSCFHVLRKGVAKVIVLDIVLHCQLRSGRVTVRAFFS